MVQVSHLIIVAGITKWLELPAAAYVGYPVSDYQMLTDQNTSLEINLTLYAWAMIIINILVGVFDL